MTPPYIVDAAGGAFRGIGRDQNDQDPPRNHTFHLLEKLPRALRRQIEVKVGLSHSFSYPLSPAVSKHVRDGFMQIFPKLSDLSRFDLRVCTEWYKYI